MMDESALEPAMDETKAGPRTFTMVLRQLKMPLAIASRPLSANSHGFDLDPFVTEFYSFIGSPIQILEFGANQYAVPSKQIARLQNWLKTTASGDPTKVAAVVDAPNYAMIPKIQPLISPELATIYESFGISVAILRYRGQRCTVLVDSIDDLVNGPLDSSQSVGKLPTARERVILRAVSVTVQEGVNSPLAQLLLALIGV